MTLIYSSDNLILIHHLRNCLEAEHIACVVKNEGLHSVVGEVPAQECWPELWVENDALAEEARERVAELLQAPEEPQPPWRCPHCGEQVEGQFAVCWQCGTPAPDGA